METEEEQGDGGGGGALPRALAAAVGALPADWRRGGAFTVRYALRADGAEAAPAAVLLRGVSVAGRLVLHARCAAAPAAGAAAAAAVARPARLVLAERALAPRVGGTPTLTDEGARALLRDCAARLLHPLSRQARAEEPGAAGGGARRAGLAALFGELQLHVLAHLPVAALARLARTARRFSALAAREELWCAARPRACARAEELRCLHTERSCSSYDNPCFCLFLR